MTADAAPTAATGRGHLPALDGLRAIAVLMVVWHHAWGRREPATLVETGFRAVSETGWAGVDLFFVLSGFLITRILLRHRDSDTLLKAFWWRRILRIWPMYYAYLALCFVILPAMRIYRFEPGPWAKWWYATFLSNVWIAMDGAGVRQPVHLWSVAVEEQFYLVWPFIVLAARGPWLRRVILALLVCVPLARAAASLSGVSFVAIYALTPLRMDGLAWGALLAVAEVAPGGLARWRGLARVAGSVAAAVGLAWIVFFTGMRPDADVPAIQAGMYTLTGLGFTALVTVVLTQPDTHPVNAWLCRPWPQAIGRWSYGIYVLHPVVLVGLRSARIYPAPRNQDAWWYVFGMTGFAVLGAILTIALAAASWRWLESPFLKLKDRVGYGAPSDP